MTLALLLFPSSPSLSDETDSRGVGVSGASHLTARTMADVDAELAALRAERDRLAARFMMQRQTEAADIAWRPRR